VEQKVKNGGKSDFQAFAEEVVRWLEGLTVEGKPYRAYIAQGRTGDEANVVDRLFTPGLLARLGYDEDRVIYNQQKGSEKPDWLVYLEPGGTPYFLVEDKATGEELAAHQKQLFRYMRRLAVPRGVLTNGQELLVYEAGEGPPTAVLYISFRELLEGGLFKEESLSALRALYGRLARARVQAKERWIEDLTITKEGKPHAPNGETWPGEARIPVVPAQGEGFLQRFTEEVKEVLGELKEDALAQLRTRLEELKAAEKRLRQKSIREEFTEVRDRLLKELEGHLSEAPMAEVKRELQAPWEEGATAWRGKADRLRGYLPRDKTSSGRVEVVLKRLEELALLYEEGRHRLEEDHGEAVQTKEAFTRWKARYGFLLRIEAKGDLERRALEEFATQTAYIFFVRLLLVRIAEDKGLLTRMFTNGGVAKWFLEVEPYYLGGGGEAPEGLKAFFSLVFGRAEREVYAHFFAEGTFDWYRPSRPLALELLWKLAHYDFRDVDQDIIGHLYAHYATKEHRHHTGMYYTPPEVVDYILDRVGFRGQEVATATLLDPACGSGTFLVRAARRVLEAFRGEGGKIPEENLAFALKAVAENLVGLDVNPFACYLAEINLLIQAMDLLEGQDAGLDRFRVYNTDTLVARFPSTAFLDGDLWPEEKVKLTPEAFDFVVGNPPYVRADAPGMKEYRDAVKNQFPLREGVEGVLQKKWDLYVPFVALALEWAKPRGKVGLLVSASIESAPFAEAIRNRLLQHTLLEVAHLNGKALFPEAVVDNTIVLAQRGSPPPGHQILRRRFTGKPPEGLEKEERVPAGEFNFRRQVALTTGSGCVPLEDICYVSWGMALHARDGSFRVENLLADAQDPHHPRPYVDGSLIDPFAPRRLRWLEHGPGLRAPARVYGPTFPELWDRNKLLFQRMLRKPRHEAIWDRGQYGSFLTANHTATVAVRWCDLRGVHNRQLGKPDTPERLKHEHVSQKYDLGYLAGLVNTKAASMRCHFQYVSGGVIEASPNLVKAIPIPPATPSQQRRVRRLALCLEAVVRKLGHLSQSGWILDPGSVRAPIKVFMEGSLAPLAAAEVAWGVAVLAPGVPLRNLRREGEVLYAGKRPVLRLKSEPEALDWFVGLGEAHDSDISGRTWQDLKASGFQVPRTRAEALSILQKVGTEKAKVEGLLERQERLWKALELTAESLYQQRC
jgi:type I restriction enzyme M protein